MNVNADFSRRVVLHADEIPWEASPMPGVERRRLDRLALDGGRERVTTIVRYAPGSRFSAHAHGGGEEFLVLEGTFEDDYGEWPAGAYVRNPPGSSHVPGSGPGCTILVKLRQFDPEDRAFVHAHLDRLGAVPEAGRPGVEVSPLYRDAREEVRAERWAPGAAVRIDAPGGAELFVLEGTLAEGGDALRAHSWLRVPPGGAIDAEAGPDGARVWLKLGHLVGLAGTG